MRQFTVPQFIDVENRIIGPITTRQFMILLASAITIGLSYKLFDFSLFVTLTVIVIIISFTFAFVKINGRPFHLFVLNIIQTWRRPNLRIWNKQWHKVKTSNEHFDIKPQAKIIPKRYKRSRLSELALIVDTKGRYKGN